MKEQLASALGAVAKAQALLSEAQIHLSSINNQERPLQRRVNECFDLTTLEAQHLDALLDQISKAIQFIEKDA